MSFNKGLLSLSVTATLVALLALASPAAAKVYVYDNNTSGTLANPGSNNAGNCPTGGISVDRTFVISDSFTVQNIAVGLNASHNNRGDIRVELYRPGTIGAGTRFVVIAGTSGTGGDTDNDYDVMLSSNSDGTNNPPLDDNTSDPTGEPYYARLVNVSTIDFYTGNSAGTWTLRVCDVRSSGGTGGTLNRVRLVLTSAASTTLVCTSTSSLSWAANGNNNAFTSGTNGGVTLTLDSHRDLTNDEVVAGGRDPFTTQTSVFGGQTGHYLMQYDDGANGLQQDPEAVLLETNWSLSPAVRQLTWKHLDVDNGSWEDYVRTFATDASGNYVPYELHFETGTVDQQAGDVVETDGANVDAADNFGNVAYIFDGPVSHITVQYLRGDDFADPAEQRIGVGDPFYCAFDYGDAPSTYGTTLATNGPKHLLGSRNIYIGPNPPDGESDGQPNSTATGDNNAAISGVNDENTTVTFGACPGNGTYSVTIHVVNLSAANAFLVGYIDWGRDGTFNTTTDRSATATVTPTGSGGADVVLTWSSVPTNCGGTTATYARFRFTSSATRAQSPTDTSGQYAPDGEVEDYQITAGTLPVTLSSFHAERDRGRLDVSWTTETETSTVGYALLARDGKEWQRIVPDLVPAHAVDSLTPQRYEVSVDDGGWSELVLEDWDVYGKATRRGPFAVGDSYGREPEVQKIDWAAIRAENDAATSPAVTGRSQAVSAPFKPGAILAELRVDREGIYRVRYEDLAAAGIDLSGVPVGQLSLVEARTGTAVPISVQTSAFRASGFGPGAAIEFRGRPVTDSLYTRTRVYTLRRSSGGGARVDMINGTPGGVDADSYVQVDAVNKDLEYSFASPDGDPWFEAPVLAQGSPAEATFPIDIDAVAAAGGSLQVKLWGVTSWPGDTPDHHVEIYLNGQLLSDQRFDGQVARSYDLPVSAGTLVDGENELTVRLPGDTGQPFDLVHVDRYGLTYPRRFMARDGRLSFPAATGTIAVDGLPSANVEVYTGTGGQRLNGVVVQPTINGWQARFSVPRSGFGGAAASSTVDVVAASALLQPTISVPRPVAGNLLSGHTDYLVISHPAFLDDLAPLVAAREADGLRVKVVDVFDVYQAYSGGEIDPEAIHAYIKAAAHSLGVRYVLLVGGDSYDYLDNLGIGSISFIPTLYAQTDDLIYFTPADSLYGDLDGDGVQDIAVGRLPARTSDELDLLIDKTLRYPATPAAAVLAADASDEGHYAATSDDLAGHFPANWPLTRAYIDDGGVTVARAALLAGFDAGPALVNFVGHSGPTVWTFGGLFAASDADLLTNVDSPSTVIQWGCWNTYHVAPEYDTLAHRLLLAGPQGAAAVVGSSTLTQESSDQLLGPALITRLFRPGVRLGDAIVQAKQSVAGGGGDLRDVLLGWTLLGDPALVVNP
jgi:subtilisin-like proprotein convertase family protein